MGGVVATKQKKSKEKINNLFIISNIEKYQYNEDIFGYNHIRITLTKHF